MIGSAVSDDRLGYYGTAVCGGLVLVLLLVYGFSGKQRKVPPGPYPWPLYGNFFLGGTHPHQAFTQLAKQYGNIMSLFFGSARVVVVSDFHMAKELFSVSDASFSSRPVNDFMKTTSKYMNYGEPDVSIAISLYTPKVRAMRQLCISELFTAQKLDVKRSTRMEEIRRMVAALAASGENIVDIRDFVSELSLRINCRTTFNKAFLHSERAPKSGTGLDPVAFRKLEAENIKLLASHNTMDVIPSLRLTLGRFNVGGIHAQWKDVTKRKVSCAESILEWYRQHEPNGSVATEESETDFVETLLRLSNEGKYSVTIARAIILELLTAGSDTIAATLEWSLLELVRHPLSMERLCAEIDSKFGMAGPVEEEEAAQLPYLQAVLMEVLRLHIPTTLGIPHSNIEDATLGGYHIPAGSTVMANFWALHRDPITWGDDALDFNPERFLGSDLSVTGTNNYQYLPFGAGRRICPGRTMAMRVLSAALGSFVHAFEWSAPPEVRLSADEGTHGLNIRPETPLLLQMNLRPAASLYSNPSTSTSDE